MVHVRSCVFVAIPVTNFAVSLLIASSALFPGPILLGMVGCIGESWFIDGEGHPSFNSPSFELYRPEAVSTAILGAKFNETETHGNLERICCSDCENVASCLENCDECIQGASFMGRRRKYIESDVVSEDNYEPPYRAPEATINQSTSSYEDYVGDARDYPLPIPPVQPPRYTFRPTYLSRVQSNSEMRKIPKQIPHIGGHTTNANELAAPCCADCRWGDIFCLASCVREGCRPAVLCEAAGRGAYGAFCQNRCNLMAGFSVSLLPEAACKGACARDAQKLCLLNKGCQDYGCEAPDCLDLAPRMCG